MATASRPEMTFGICCRLGVTRPGSTRSGDMPQCSVPPYWLRKARVMPTETLLSITTTEPGRAYLTTEEIADTRCVASTD